MERPAMETDAMVYWQSRLDELNASENEDDLLEATRLDQLLTELTTLRAERDTLRDRFAISAPRMIQDTESGSWRERTPLERYTYATGMMAARKEAK